MMEDTFRSAAEEANLIIIRRIGSEDVFVALQDGLADFLAAPTHYLFAILIYPVIGIALFVWASKSNAYYLIYPLMAGFALVGPFAALGLYEISRQREAGLAASWKSVLGIVRSPALPAIGAVGLVLGVHFIAWLASAQILYLLLFGAAGHDSLAALLLDVITTGRGWALLALGNALGFLFALAVLCSSAITFPLLLDRNIGARAAMAVSAQTVRLNPGPMLLWGFIVAALLLVGVATALVGLIVVLPVLGHGTWHLYRRLIAVPSP